jgi:hypothetical protein
MYDTPARQRSSSRDSHPPVSFSFPPLQSFFCEVSFAILSHMKETV